MRKKCLIIAIIAFLSVGMLISCNGDTGESVLRDNNRFKVSFDMQGHGKQIDPTTRVISGELISKPENPTETGYTFNGWYQDSDCLNEWDYYSDVVTSDITLYAKWTPNTYRVTFVKNDGDPEDTFTEIGQKYDGYYTLPKAVPERLDYVFTGWFTKAEGGTPVTEDTIVKNASDHTLFAQWKEDECIAAGTKITMSDGSSKLVEELKVGDYVRTFDHESGTISYAPVCFVMKSENVSGAFTLHFDNNIDVTVIDEHGFYDNDLNKYVFINADNAEAFIGHHFYNGDQMCQIELKSFEVLDDRLDAYAIVTSKHLNHMAEGMLSVCDGTIKHCVNLFGYDNDMKINQANKVQEIQKYGLTAKEAFTNFAGFEDADYEDYNLQYTDIMIGKGLFTWEAMERFYNLFAE